MRRSLSRRSFLRHTGAGLAGLGLGGCLPLSSRPIARSGRRHPNIILLVTDDQRADALGVVNPLVQTPNLDALAHDGVHFTNAYVTTSICCCSRASMFTGQHLARHGIGDFRSPFSPQAAAATYYQVLRRAGYRTGFIGKYGVGTARDLPREDFDVWQGFGGQGRYETTDEHGRYKHLTRVLGDQALAFLDGCDGRQAFCLSVSFKAAHCQDGDPRQFIYDPAYKHLYEDVTIPPPAASEPAQWEGFPDFFKTNNEARKRWQVRFSTPEKYQASVKNYYRLLYGADVQIGRIRRKLAEKGWDDNTLIVFVGDNGFFLGEHGLAGKWYAQEESIRVPLIVVDPRLPAARRGRRCARTALNIDLAPTLLRAAHVPVPAAMQGADLGPLVRGEDVPEWRRDFYYDHRVPIRTIPPCEALVGERWKYVLYPESPGPYEQLFDLENDPHETRNLAESPEHQDQLRRMQLRFAELRKQAR